MDPHHRKIDLQSPQDFTYLLANIKNAAQQKLDLAIPPSAAPKGEEDAFRTKVEALVQQYITQTLSLALPSLSINGLDAFPSLLEPPTPTNPGAINLNDPNYEPYDAGLATKLRGLYATLEAETTRVAQLRREAPGAAARGYMERLEAEMEAEEKAMEQARKGVRNAAGRRGTVEVELVRGKEVQASWEKGVKGLEDLKGVTEGVAKLERALKAMREVEMM